MLLLESNPPLFVILLFQPASMLFVPSIEFVSHATKQALGASSVCALPATIQLSAQLRSLPLPTTTFLSEVASRL